MSVVLFFVFSKKKKGTLRPRCFVDCALFIRKQHKGNPFLYLLDLMVCTLVTRCFCCIILHLCDVQKHLDQVFVKAFGLTRPACVTRDVAIYLYHFILLVYGNISLYVNVCACVCVLLQIEKNNELTNVCSSQDFQEMAPYY